MNYIKDEFPLVSVIINCYNGEKYLQSAIDSVYAQTYSNWEIIFWDNASTDDSALIAKQYNSKIKYYKGSEIVPLYHARNLALEKCNGMVVTFLDCDDIWTDDKLEKQITLYNNGKKFIYGRFDLIDSNGHKLQKKLDQLKSGNVTNSLLRNNFISIGTVMIDRTLLCKLKFDSDFNVIGDFDLWVRASMKTNFHYVDDIIEKSRRHNNNLGTQLKDEWIIEERVLYKKYLRLYGLLRMPMVLVYIIKSELKSIVNRTLFLKKYIEKFNLYN